MGGPAEQSLEYGGATGLGSTSAQKLWKNVAEESEPRPLQIEYNCGLPAEDTEIFEDLGLPGHQKVAETVFEDPEEANIRPRLLVPLQSVLGLKALCEREYIRTETVTEMLNQCRTAYYKELLYLREQLILAAEPEKQMLLASVQNYEVYYFNPPAYVDEDLKEYMMNCSRWTHKKLIEENYELQMKLAGQEDVFENADFCMKGLLRRHGTYRMFKVMHNIVKNAKDLFNPEDMIRKKETEGLKPIDELQAAVIELFPNLKAKEDNSGILLAEIEELQKTVTDLRAELAKVKDLLEKERSRADSLNRKCEEQMKLLKVEEVEVVKQVDNEDTLTALKQLKDLKQRLEEEAQAQAKRLRKQLDDFAKAKSLQTGSSKADASKLVPKLDEAVSDAEQLFKAIANLPAQVVKVQGTKEVGSKSGEESAMKEIQQLQQEIEALKAKLAAAERREQDALQKLKELQSRPGQVVKSESTGPGMPEDYEELKTRLERKLARIAELEADLDQAKRDLRAANRKVEEQELLLQEKARKDAEKAKQMSDLMEKLRKSEEEAEQLGGKLYNAQEKIKKLKEEIRELKNKLGMEVKESDGEEEEEANTGASFMSRYYLRAKNSGKPRWMLLSEDAKLKSQRTEHMQNQAHQHVSSNFQAANALQFLRRAPSSNEGQRPRGVRLQYGNTQEWYSPDSGMGDGTPAYSGGFSRQGSFHMGHNFTDGSAASPGGPRFLATQGSGNFYGDASPQQSFQHSFSRQGTASLAGVGGFGGMGARAPGSPVVGTASRQGTPPGVLMQSMGYRPGMASPVSGASPFGQQRQFTPPTGMAREPLGGPRIAASSTSGLAGEAMGATRLNMQGTSLLQGPTSLGGPAGPMGGPTGGPMGGPMNSPMGGPMGGPVGGPVGGPMGGPMGGPGPLAGPMDGQASTGLMSAAFPLRLPPGAADENRGSSSATSAASSDSRHPDFHHANSASMSPTSCRLHHVGLASPGGHSPFDGPLLELIPQDYASAGQSSSSSPTRRGPLQPLRQHSSSALPVSLNQRMGGEASPPLLDDAVVARRLLMDPGSQSVPVWRKYDLPSEGSTRATEQSTPSPSRESPQVPRPPMHKSPTSPLLGSMSNAQAADRGPGLTASKTASSFRQAEADLEVTRVQTSPVTGATGLETASQKVMSWAGQSRPSAPKPLTNGALAQGRGRLPPTRSYTTSSLESTVEYVQADALPRLPAGKVKKAAPTPSWMSAIF